MIAKYHESFFIYEINEIKDGQVRIWRFEPFEDFSMRITRKGNHIYEKFIDITEIEDIFDVAFAVEWSGHWFGAEYWPVSQTVRLFSTDTNVIEKFNMSPNSTASYHYPFDKGVWDLYVDIDSCNGFKVTYEDYRTGEYTSQTVSKEEWIDLWNKFIVELLPH